MRILYIEDDDILASFVQVGLKPRGFVVDHVANAEDGLAAMAGIAYDAILLDLNLPDADGIAILRKLRSERNATPVLILSSRGQTSQRINGLDAGADDYLAKPFDIGELSARLYAVSRRSKLLNSDLTCGNVTFLPSEQTAIVAGKPVTLRRREASLLECLLRGAGRPVTRSVIEDQLYSFGEEVASNSVEVHVHRLRKQLGTAGATVRIETLRGIGYMLSETVQTSEAKCDRTGPE